MPYKNKADKDAANARRYDKRHEAKRAGKVETRERTSGDVRGKLYNPGPWRSPEPRPWERLGIK